MSMLNRQFRQMRSVQVKDNIVLVGERHYDPNSTALIQSVLGSVDDLGGVALEKNKPSLLKSCDTGMDHAEKYAFDSHIKRHYIDKSTEWLYDQLGSEEEAESVISNANFFSVLPDNNGNVNIKAICDSRRRIYEEHGRDAYNAVFRDREIHMAKNLNRIRKGTDGYVVAVVGVFHIFALLDFMDITEEDESLYENLEEKTCDQTIPSSLSIS